MYLFVSLYIAAAGLTLIYPWITPVVAGSVLLVALLPVFFPVLISVFFPVGAGMLLTALALQDIQQSRIPDDWRQTDVQISGCVAGIPKHDSVKQRFVLKVRGMDPPPANKLPDKVALSWYQTERKVEPGQCWQFTTRLRNLRLLANQSGFDYPGWMYRNGIVATGYIRQSDQNRQTTLAYDSLVTRSIDDVTGVIDGARWAIIQRLSQIVGFSDAGALMPALLTGDRSQIPTTYHRIFRDTGTSHLLAISGLHIGMLSAWGWLIGGLLWRLADRLALLRVITQRVGVADWAAVVALLVALTYSALAGFALSTQRALIMLAVVLVFRWLRRDVHTLQPVGMALVLVVTLDPLSLLSPGLWFSFVAVLTLLLMPDQSGVKESRHWSMTGNKSVSTLVSNTTSTTLRWIKSALVVHALLTVVMFPLTTLFFGQGSVIAVIANLVAVPVVSLLIVPPLFIWLLLDLLPALSGDWVLWKIHWVMQQLLLVLSWLADLPLASIKLDRVTAGGVALAGAGVVLWYLPLIRRYRLLVLVLLFPLLVPVTTQRVRPLTINVLDVGQGLAVIVRTSQHTLLYDTGGRLGSRTSMASQVIVPWLKGRRITRIDKLIVSHGDSDHSAGIKDVLDAYPNTPLVVGQPVHDGQARECRAGQQWVWDDVLFAFVHPQTGAAAPLSDNNRSCALLIIWQGNHVLLPGDLELAGEWQLLANLKDRFNGHPPALDLVVAPHHGSDTSSGQPFVDLLRPRRVVYSVGHGNRFGFPHESVQMRYKIRGTEEYRTDRDGELEFFWGQQGQAFDPIRWRRRLLRRWHQP